MKNKYKWHIFLIVIFLALLHYKKRRSTQTLPYLKQKTLPFTCKIESGLENKLEMKNLGGMNIFFIF